MQPLQYIQTTAGLIWTILCPIFGFALTFAAYFIINKVPAKWLCDYNETPSPELLSGKRVNYAGSGIVLSIVSSVCFAALRWQFNKGYDIYFIMLMLIIFAALMITVCDFKYTIIPDQFTVLLGVLGLMLSVYDIVRGYHILHSAWWSPLAGAGIGAAVMILVDLIGMLVYKKDGMGFGDVKLFFAVGILTGFPGTIYTLLISLITATVCFAVIILVSKIKNGGNASETGEDTNEVMTETDTGDSDEPEENESDAASEEEEQLSFHSYLAFGPYIAIAIIVYLTLFDGIKYLAGLYLNLF